MMPFIVLRALGWLKSNPMIALCFILAAWAGVERHQAHKWQSRAEACETASQAAVAATKVLRAKEARQSKKAANHVQTEHIAARPASDAASRAFVARNRVQPKGDSSPTVAVDQAGDPGLPAPVSSETVMVPSEDVLTCGRLYDYALDAHNHAVMVGE